MKVKVAVCGNETRTYKNFGLKEEGPFKLTRVETHSTHGHAIAYAIDYEDRMNKNHRPAAAN